MRVYIIRDEAREKLLQLSLDFITNDPEIAPYVCFCDLPDLEEKVKVDLLEFGKAWDSGKGIDKFIPPYYIDESLKKLYLLPFEIPSLQNLLISKRSFDKNFVLKKLQDMESSYSKYKFDDVFRNGWDALNMLRLKPPGKYREYRTLWAKFLSLWSGACNWYGYINVSFGSLWASKSLMEIYRLLEAWPLFSQSAGSRASTLYTLAGIEDAKCLEAGFRWQNVLKGKHLQHLNQALSYCNYACIKSNRVEGGLLSIRGNIYRELGNYRSAISDFRHAIYIGGSKEYHASILADLGLTLILKGKHSEGMRNLEISKEMCDRFKYNSPWTARILKRVGEGLIAIKSWNEAEKQINEALQLGRQLKLGHQVITMIADLHMIEKEKK